MGYKELGTQTEYYETWKDSKLNKNRSENREKGGTGRAENNKDLIVKLGNVGERDWMEEENEQHCDRNEELLKCEKIKVKELEN